MHFLARILLSTAKYDLAWEILFSRYAKHLWIALLATHLRFVTPIRQRRGCLRKIQIESQSPFVAAGMSSGNRGIIKDSAPMYPTIGGREPGPHMPRRLKGRLEVRRELRLYHHPAPKYTLCRSKSRTLCINLCCIGSKADALHWGTFERWATLAPPSSFVIIATAARSPLPPGRSSSKNQWLAAPQVHSSTAPDFFPTPKPRLLCSLLNSKPSTPTTSIEVLSILSVLHFAQNSWNLAPPPPPLSYLHFWTWLV